MIAGEADLGSDGQEPMRLCPECRMPISMWATRCRYCGSTVGRPRKETEKLTVEDLGGESHSNYTVSGNVKEALEAFMTDERAQMDEGKDRKGGWGWFGKKSTHEGQEPVAKAPSRPAVETNRQDLASMVLDMPSQSNRQTKRKRSQAQLLLPKLFFGCLCVAGLVVLYFACTFGVQKYREYKANMAPKEAKISNHALSLLQSGKPPFEALEEALSVLKRQDTPENRSIADQVRTKFIEDSEKRVFCVPYDAGQIDIVSEEVSKAVKIDNDNRVQQLFEKVNKELDFYKFILMSIDESKKTATFRLNNPGYPEKEQTVAENDLLQGRFAIKRIGPGYVRMEDTKIPDAEKTPRVLVSRTLMPVTAN